ncbi:hypothetical protein EDC55_11126 [Allofrancisella inopinata]|nr:hypothetical protein [Allofrancisella inopinata]TDT71622.1 hypothetical protein EDC55_11126 [Allofrancisella inopinata]
MTTLINKEFAEGNFTKKRYHLKKESNILYIILYVSWKFEKGWSILSPINTEEKFKNDWKNTIESNWSRRFIINIDGEKLIPIFKIIEADPDNEKDCWNILVKNMASGRSCVNCFSGNVVLYSGALDSSSSTKSMAMNIGYKLAFGQWSNTSTITHYSKTKLQSILQISNENELIQKLKNYVNKGCYEFYPITIYNNLGLYQRIKKENIYPNITYKEALNIPPKITIKGRSNIEVMHKDSYQDFPIAVHEFGHMIGLPDEYLSDSHMNEDIRDICNKFNIEIPDFDSNNKNLMSMGDRFLPFYYSTILFSLYKMYPLIKEVSLIPLGEELNITTIDNNYQVVNIEGSTLFINYKKFNVMIDKNNIIIVNSRNNVGSFFTYNTKECQLKLYVKNNEVKKIVGHIDKLTCHASNSRISLTIGNEFYDLDSLSNATHFLGANQAYSRNEFNVKTTALLNKWNEIKNNYKHLNNRYLK